MYRLTEIRLKQAEIVLEKYREKLFVQRRFDAMVFERELRDLWKTGYREMKSIARDLLKNERYREVALWYMQNSNGDTGVAEEFKRDLASTYGLRAYDTQERAEQQARFWSNFFESKESLVATEVELS